VCENERARYGDSLSTMTEVTVELVLAQGKVSTKN